MKKLTQAQEKALAKIIDYIKFAKKFNNFKDYYIAEQLRGLETRFDYQELVKHYTQRYEQDEAYYTEHYKHYWLDALNNIALTSRVSSSTLKALENLGYIEIINDGRNFVDTIKLLRTDLLEEVRA